MWIFNDENTVSFIHWLVYDKNILNLRCLNTGQKYYFGVNKIIL
jgi:hypothetical protein